MTERDRTIGLMLIFYILLIFQATDIYATRQQKKRSAQEAALREQAATFYQAVEENDVETVRTILDQRPELVEVMAACPCYGCDFHRQGRYRSPLFDAEVRGNREVAELLRSRGGRSWEQPNRFGGPHEALKVRDPAHASNTGVL